MRRVEERPSVLDHKLVERDIFPSDLTGYHQALVVSCSTLMVEWDRAAFSCSGQAVAHGEHYM